MISWLAETMLGVTLLMVVALAARRPVARFCGAGWAYALWLLPALRLVLPPLALPRFGVDIPLPPITVIIPAMDGVTASLPAEAGPGQWVPFMLALWAGGAVTFLLWHWLSYRAFLKALKASSRPGDPPVYGGIETLASDAVDGPLAVGVFERRIVLPPFFSRRYTPGERRLAMEHELVHHRRGDIMWNIAGLVILALNWFNPVAWIAFHAFRSDQELACDAAVARNATGEERHDYARAMVKSASRPGLIAACPLNRADELKRRLRMIRSHRGGKARMAGGLAAFAALLTAGLALSNPARPPERQIVYVAAPAAAPAWPAARPAPALALGQAVERPARRSRSAHALAVPTRLLASAEDVLLKAPLGAAEPEPKGFATIEQAIASAEAQSPAGAAPIHAAGTAGQGDIQPVAFVRLAQADMVMSGDGRLRLRPASAGEARIVSFEVEGNTAHLVVAGGWTTDRLAAVKAAVERAIAEADDSGTREQLGQVIAALERRKDKLGMMATLN
jgi:bla regulator protein BlaR1